MLKFAPIALLLIGSYAAASTRRFQLGSEFFTVGSLTYFDEEADYTTDGSPEVHAIQKDEWIPGNLLVAIGNAIYTVDRDGDFHLLAGHLMMPGFQDGYGNDARFNHTAGIAQLPDGKVLISDMNNHCVRELDRRTREVTTYAGNCTAEPTYYDYENYVPWETFNKPTTLQYVASPTPKIYILDSTEYVGFGIVSWIISKTLDGYDTISKIERYAEIHYFAYDPDTSTFAYVDSTHIVNISAYGIARNIALVNQSHGMTVYDGIAIASSYDTGIITLADQQRHYGNVVTICNTDFYEAYMENLPRCSLKQPNAVAVIDGYLYVGSTFRSSYNEVGLRRITFSTNGTKKEERTTTTKSWNWWDPVTTTTTKSWNWWDPVTTKKPWTWNVPSVPDYTIPPQPPVTFPTYTSSYDNDDDIYDYYDSGLSGGTVAIIVIAVILGVGLKVALITFRVRRYNNRVILRRRLACRTTVVAVSSTTTRRVPYGRLQESPEPSGQFPTPPPYSAEAPTTPPQYQPQQAPPTGPGQEAPPPAYSSNPPSVQSNPPSQPPPTRRY